MPPSLCLFAFQGSNFWHLMLDKKMNRRELREKTGISTASIAKLSKGENITTDVLIKICVALDCDITEIMELSREDEMIKEINDDQQ